MTASPHTVAEMIRRQLEGLTPTERKAALVLLGNYPVPGLQTVAQFAKQAEVSNPTILRLISKLGFSAYADFQQRLRDELEDRLRSPLTKDVRPSEVTDGEDATAYSAYWASVTEAMSASRHLIRPSEFDGTIALLSDGRRPVTILGGRLTSSLAMQMYLHLRELRSDVHLIQSQTGSWAEHLLDVNSSHTFVIFDIRRYQDDVVRMGQEASARGAKLILFTDEWLSPLSAVAKHVFALRIAVNSNWDSFAPLSALIEAMIARLSALRWPEIKMRIEELEAARRKLDL
ncbi:MurR/RpiR family transcriptional regulator [Hyphomicrobium sp. 99]|uniref:MurR/RpiR family transcriptional regulator n=1 Tax=Hyphomicrobium sp. 99 TaxID=1163419 RepID=UPI0005F7B739|nr:MurR/RpiR family transcriptional regulator [Hyphomicrobium sp. 99]